MILEDKITHFSHKRKVYFLIINALGLYKLSINEYVLICVVTEQ